MSSDFDVTAELDVACPRGRLVEFAHPHSGARHVHLDCDDDVTAFMLCVRAPAPDNSGLTHVLEHLLLSGSERFAGPNPFFAMMKQSVAATMNASTGCELMRLHFATRHPRDFDNLLAFYLDSAFFPRLRQPDFNREAGRVTHDGPRGAPRFNGVIHNEMKGAMSRPEFHLRREIHRQLFPATCHGLNEGGDWWRIPALSLQQVRDYHRRCFVAANTIFLTYGRVDARRCQDRFLDLALARCESGEERALPVAPGLERPTETDAPLPLDVDPPRYFHARGIRLSGEDQRTDAVIAGLIMKHLRRYGAGAGNRRSASTDAPAWLDDSGLIFRGREPVLVLALETSGPAAAGDPVHRAVERLEADPPGLDALNGGMARVRTRLLDDQTGKDAAGIRVLERLADSAVYGDTLSHEPERTIERAFQVARDRGQLRRWIRRHMMENADQVTLTARTDRARFHNILEEERRCVATVIQRGPAPLAETRPERQDPQNASLPALPDSQLIPMAGPDIEFQPARGAAGVEFVPGELGDLCYLTLALAPESPYPVVVERLALDVEAVRQSLRRRADCLDGTVALRVRITGNCHVWLTADITAPADHAASVARSVLASITEPPRFPADFDPDAARAGRIQLTAARGHEIALKSAFSRLGVNGAADHCINGLGLLPALDPPGDRARIMETGGISVGWTLARALVQCVGHHAAAVIDQAGFPPADNGPAGMHILQSPVGERTDLAWIVPTSVAHCALAVAVEPLDLRRQAAAAVLCRILIDRILEPAIRFDGGAYGVDCRYVPEYNAIGMCSFRDPGIGRTLDHFHQALQQLEAGDFDDTAVARGKISELARIEKLCRTRVLKVRRAFDFRLDGCTTSPAHGLRMLLEVSRDDLRAAASAVHGRDGVSHSVVCGPDYADELERRGFELVAAARQPQ